MVKVSKSKRNRMTQATLEKLTRNRIKQQGGSTQQQEEPESKSYNAVDFFPDKPPEQPQKEIFR